MLKDKVIVLGISGGIAAYKMANLASRLSKEGCKVHVIMTKNATEFITPLTFETLTSNKCIVDTFDRNFKWDVEHVEIAKSADAILIAPATANIIAKMANGICDDMLTTTVLAATCVKLISPAMNTNMYENPITQRNIETLKSYGFKVIEPDSGLLACKDIGKGRLPDTDVLYNALDMAIGYDKDLAGLKITVTAGPTIEAIDPVRFISNHSSGKMGYAIAKIAALRGADVTLISGKSNLETPYGVNRIDVLSAKDMFEAVKDNIDSDIIIKSAAVADFTPDTYSEQKIKKSAENNMSISLTKTTDILAYLGKHKKENQFICGFAMETENLIENAKIKLINKNVDMIVANSLTEEGAGFCSDTNIATFITKDGIFKQDKMSKEELAIKIIDKIISMRK